MSKIDQEARNKALEIINQWIKEEDEERIKKIEVDKSPEKMNINNSEGNKRETSKDAVKVTEAASTKEKVIDFILKQILKYRLIVVGLF